jgi:hypothetical protein
LLATSFGLNEISKKAASASSVAIMNDSEISGRPGFRAITNISLPFKPASANEGLGMY